MFFAKRDKFGSWAKVSKLEQRDAEKSVESSIFDFIKLFRLFCL
jgi:hypothetical protein